MAKLDGWKKTAGLVACLATLVALATLVIGGAFTSEVLIGAHSPGQLGDDPSVKAYPWLYQRPGFSEAGWGRVDILAVGDVMPGRQAALSEDPFSASAALLKKADLTLGNLECAITAAVPSPEVIFDPARREPILLLAPPRAAELLKEAGFDVVNLANNHSLDAGVEGLAETVGYLQQEKIGWTGAGEADQAFTPYLLNLKDLRIAVIGYTAIPVPDTNNVIGIDGSEQPDLTWSVAQRDIERFLEAVRQAHQQADLVIVSIHWGYEYQEQVDPAQRSLAARIFEAGADVILGHHPHVVQDVDLVEDAGTARVVAYSLGNFLFDQEFGSTRQAVALRIVVDRQGLAGVQVLDVEAGLKPHFKEYAAAGSKAYLPVDSFPIAFTCDRENCQQVESDASYPAVDTFQDEVDLDGDGITEQYRLQDDTLVVFKGEVEVWRSPPEWEVVDVAHGDPDWDGRQDLVLAFWRPDAQGVLRSHPFVMGYRQGVFRTLWGGSAVSDPILEIELGDLDGDEREELIVLERRPDGFQRAISVWRWHGWGFSQFWRSPAGWYEDLQFLPAGDGESARIQALHHR